MMGFLGGPYGYACEFENETFLLFPDYQNEQPKNYPGCNFRHKASGFEVKWYKWIGRSMELSRPITGAEWLTIFKGCVRSLPIAAKKEARRQMRHEATPTFKKERDDSMQRMMEILSNPEKYNAPKDTFKCNACGRTVTHRSWTKTITGQCADCIGKLFK